MEEEKRRLFESLLDTCGEQFGHLLDTFSGEPCRPCCCPPASKPAPQQCQCWWMVTKSSVWGRPKESDCRVQKDAESNFSSIMNSRLSMISYHDNLSLACPGTALAHLVTLCQSSQEKSDIEHKSNARRMNLSWYHNISPTPHTPLLPKTAASFFSQSRFPPRNGWQSNQDQQPHSVYLYLFMVLFFLSVSQFNDGNIGQQNRNIISCRWYALVYYTHSWLLKIKMRSSGKMNFSSMCLCSNPVTPP